MRKNVLGKTGLIDKQFLIEGKILNLAKNKKQVIYGARSIQKQAPFFARDTKDYDIFDKSPKKSADLMQKILDKNVGFDHYYMKEAEHKGTWKVKNRGLDGKKNTKDDESIVDYTEMPSNIPFVVINDIRYRKLSEEIKKKKQTIKDPEFKFRHPKDKDDLRRVKEYLKVKRMLY